MRLNATKCNGQALWEGSHEDYEIWFLFETYLKHFGWNFDNGISW